MLDLVTSPVLFLSMNVLLHLDFVIAELGSLPQYVTSASEKSRTWRGMFLRKHQHAPTFRTHVATFSNCKLRLRLRGA